ncbi:metal-dependent phosphohydrolase HD subdomain [Vibrio maritimus]|uniref:Metal-dependent phosphohydrolase HD subdomain n=1 Tax=Vibrio maritimus TaxID=990268 RepID=A0A090SX05_9VIBR|nr:metal-dependent phosphohydrolase HD subdomain [Vibrio maritimus]
MLFSRYRELIGEDYMGYRNHVYRTITYALHFLDNAEEYEQIVETAFVYHDIGLWTDHELAYLEPSEAVALADNAEYGWGLDPELLRGAIHWHHKITPYKASIKKSLKPAVKLTGLMRQKVWFAKG